MREQTWYERIINFFCRIFKEKNMDNEFFNFDAVVEIEKKKSYEQGRKDAIDEFNRSFLTTDQVHDLCTEAQKRGRENAIDECIKAIVNTPTKVGTHLKDPQKVDVCLTMFADRQNEIINLLEQLKEVKNDNRSNQ